MGSKIMKLKKTKNLSNEEATAYLRKLQSDVCDLLSNIASEQVSDIERAIEYRDDAICSGVFEDYEVIRRLKVFTSLEIEV